MRTSSALLQPCSASTSKAVAGAQTIRPAWRSTPHLHRSGVHCLAQSSSSAQDPAARFTSDIQDSATRFAQEAQSKWKSFTKEQKLEERVQELGRSASTKAREAVDELQGSARRAFMQLDSEYELTGKASRAAKQLKETAKDVDQTYSVRRKLRSAQDYCQRKWPSWQRQAKEFSATWYGQAVLFIAFFVLVTSPIFWRLLNVGVLLWWLSIPLSYMLIDVARKRQAERLQQEEQERARRSNPFADMFRPRTTATAGRSASASTSAMNYNNRRKYTQQPDSPIIEAEWVSLDEGDDPKQQKQKGTRRK